MGRRGIFWLLRRYTEASCGFTRFRSDRIITPDKVSYKDDDHVGGGAALGGRRRCWPGAGHARASVGRLGPPVAWWAVLKLPSHVQSPDGPEARVVPTPCDCPAPDCSNVPTRGWPALETRATGLCYLYADSKHPQFRHFRDVGFDCLGQGERPTEPDAQAEGGGRRVLGVVQRPAQWRRWRFPSKQDQGR